MTVVVAGEANESVGSLGTPNNLIAGVFAAAWTSPETVMTHSRYSLASTVVLSLMATGFVPRPAGAADATVSWHVPGTFPIGLEAPVAAELSPNVDGVTFKLDVPGRDAIAVQRDSQTNQLRFLTSIDEASVGKTAFFKLSPYDGEPVVRVEKQKGGLQFYDGDRRVMFYQRDPTSLDSAYERANYLHPLLGLDGETLTQDFPSDHKHHRGVFWAWHQLWVGDMRAGDAWATKDGLFVVKRAEVVDQGPVFATVKLLVHWVSPLITRDREQQPIVEETTLIRLFHATDASQCIDFEIRLKPLLPDVKIGGSENVKGYSGFTVRIKPPKELAITDVGGRLESDGVGTVSAWADASGRYSSNERVSGIGILCHPSIPAFPPRWVLRHYGMQNVAYPGREPVPLPADQPLVLRHRLVIHRGDVTASRISDHQKAYETDLPESQPHD